MDCELYKIVLSTIKQFYRLNLPQRRVKYEKSSLGNVMIRSFHEEWELFVYLVDPLGRF